MINELSREEEIKKIKEEMKFEGRRKRRKIERMLQKKYGDKSIRIGYGKTFTKKKGIYRNLRRAFAKDKNLIRELLAIIKKYFPKLFDMFSCLTDERDQRYTTYSMKTICITRLFGLVCGLTSMTAITDDFDTDLVIKNMSDICGEDLTELPYWQTIQDVFMDIKTDELREIQKYIVTTLIRSKMFNKYKYKGYFHLVFDGTGLSSHYYNLNENCLKRTYKSGKVVYYKYVLECKLVVGNIVISLDTEFIENQRMMTEKEKQDCETNAFKRMFERIKKNYPKQKFLITGDGLYATDPIIKLCSDEKRDYHYIFNLKPNRLKNINETFECKIVFGNETKHKNYYLSTGINYMGHTLSAFKYIETRKNEKGEDETVEFRYISDLDVNDDTIIEIVQLGRDRWKIENNAFYQQKHGTFNISHANSRNDTALKNHYFFIQFAHTIRQLLEQGNLITKSLDYTLKKISTELTHALTKQNSNLSNIDINFQLRFDT